MRRNHLERRGFKPNPDKIPPKGSHKIAGAITGRRARKEWPCAAEECCLPDIEWDELYVELLEPQDYRGPAQVVPRKRFHLSCAERRGLIERAGTEKINRRAAVAMTKARNANVADG